MRGGNRVECGSSLAGQAGQASIDCCLLCGAGVPAALKPRFLSDSGRCLVV